MLKNIRSNNTYRCYLGKIVNSNDIVKSIKFANQYNSSQNFFLNVKEAKAKQINEVQCVLEGKILYRDYSSEISMNKTLEELAV